MPWTYYVFWLAATAGAAALSHPVVLVVALVALVGRRWLPDPIQIARYAGRVRSLRAQVELNPANAVARAQLAEIWLDKRRPRRAIPLLEQALVRDPESAELRYLLGIARLRAGDAQGALGPLGEALRRDAKLRYGSAYLAIGDALAAVGRRDEAIEAYRRFLRINTSSLEGYCKISAACERNRDDAGAKRWRGEALDTYRALPPFQRRKQLGWWLRAKLAI
ncbi:MAG TPA: tetratricopeptide repeat protein [Kofleriaceae bacterium]|nr:tetratricopeptide repeat protein [Kofleriaceae bacterium]